jgi:hypothetical protein
MNIFELFWFILHLGLLLIGAAWLCQSLAWYLAIPASMAGVAALIGLEFALTKMMRR